MEKKYRATLQDGREIYIPNWPVDVALQNLSQIGKLFGNDSVIMISELNIPMAMKAIMECEDHETCAAMVKHFLCQARIDGDKILPNTINEMFEGELFVVVELFTHIVHSQYHDFFNLGLAKGSSQES